MTPAAKALMDQIAQKTQELVPLIEALKKYVAENSINMQELTDIAFSTRETATYLKEFTKIVNEVHKQAAAFTCITMAHLGEEIVRTDYCTATADPKPWYRIPYKRDSNPEAWDLIMEEIGVNDPARTNDLVRFHPPSLMAYCAKFLAEGRQPLAGINPKEMTAMELNLRITKRR